MIPVARSAGRNLSFRLATLAAAENSQAVMGRLKFELPGDFVLLVFDHTLLGEIGKRRGRTPAQIALNWVICKGAVPIPGVKNRRQAEEIIGVTGWRLSQDEIADMDALSLSFSPDPL